MNTEEAIELLCAYGVPLDEQKFREALDMAIKALQALCTNGCEYCEYTECPLA